MGTLGCCCCCWCFCWCRCCVLGLNKEHNAVPLDALYKPIEGTPPPLGLHSTNMPPLGYSRTPEGTYSSCNTKGLAARSIQGRCLGHRGCQAGAWPCTCAAQAVRQQNKVTLLHSPKPVIAAGSRRSRDIVPALSCSCCCREVGGCRVMAVLLPL
jgi:hypothetical protein